MKRLLLFGALCASALSPVAARAQDLYVVSPPVTTPDPTYSGTWNDLFNAGADDDVATVPIGFSFTFYGKSYSSVDVSVNGLLLFENSNPVVCGSGGDLCYDAAGIPDATLPNALLAFWWQDMLLDGSGRYLTTGATGDRVLAIRFERWGEYDVFGSTLDPRTVTVELYERSGAIRIVFGAISGTTGGAASVGIEDSAGATGLPGLTCSSGVGRCSDAQWPTGKSITFTPSVNPDLFVAGLVGSPLMPAQVGGQDGYGLDLTITVKNQGQNDANGFVWDYYVSPLPPTSSGGLPLGALSIGSHVVPESLPGRTQNEWTDHVEFRKPSWTGNFYLLAYLDPANAVTESIETNNIGATLPYLNDPELSGDVSGPAGGAPGDTVGLRVVVRNNGIPATPQFTYEVSISTDAVLDAVDPKVLTAQLTLQGGETYDQTVQATLPAGLANGAYYFIISVDTTNAVLEANESNNVTSSSGTISLSGADLLAQTVAVGSPALPHAPTTDAFFGEEVWVEIAVQNIGGATARDFALMVVLSDNAYIGLGDVDVTPAGTGPFTAAGGAAVTWSGLVRIPTTKPDGVLFVDGTYWLGLIADPFQQVAESNENNNKAMAQIRIRQPAIDFTPVRVDASAAGAVGEVLPVYRVIRNVGNRGNDGAADQAVEFRYVLSSNDIISLEDIPLPIVTGGTSQPGGALKLAAGAEDRGTDLVLLPPDISPGSYWVGVLIDPDSKVYELDKRNNAAASTGTVEIAPSSLRIETSYLPDALVGVDYLQELVVSGCDGACAWSLEPDQGALPIGLALSEGGVLSGRPEAAGSAVFTVKVVSGQNTDRARLVLRVINPSGALAVLTDRLPVAVKGKDYLASLAAVGGVRPYAWSVADGALPDGLGLTPTGSFAGRPSRSYATPVAFTAAVLDAHGSRATSALSIRVVEPGALVVATVKLGDAMVAEPYSFQLQALGGRAPLAWTVVSGALPEGIRLTGDALSGIAVLPGLYPLAVEVRDADAASDRSALLLTVLPKPAIFRIGPLPEAKPGEDYSYDLSAGAAPGSFFAVFSGELPPGISMDKHGALFGTVGADATPRAFDFVIEVTEPSGAQVLAPLSIRVASPAAATPPPKETGCSSAGGAAPSVLCALLALIPFARTRRHRSPRPPLRRAERGLSRGRAWALVAGAVAAILAVPLSAHAGYRATGPVSQAFVPIAGTPLNVVPGSTTTQEQTLALPFPFRFWGVTYTTVNVGFRGYLSFTGSARIDVPTGLPTTDLAQAMIAPWWGNWQCSDGAVAYDISGVAPQRVLTVQWNRVWYLYDSRQSANGATFQARLHETTGKIELVYGTSGHGNYSATSVVAGVGVQNETGTRAVTPLACTDAATAACLPADFPTQSVIVLEQPADLALSQVFSDELGYEGVPFRVGASVKNQGGADTSGVVVRFFLSADPTPDAADQVLGDARAVDLATGQRRDVVVSIVMPPGLPGPTAYLWAKVDPQDLIAEDDETNNTAPAQALAFKLGAPAPDLAVGGISVPATARAGETIVVSRTVKNLGNAHVGPCSTDAECGGATCLLNRCRPACGGTPACPAPLACAGALCESPTCADDADCPVNESCSTGTCVARPIAYAIYLSDNPVITAADLKLADAVLPAGTGIAAFGGLAGADSVQLPADLHPGDHYIGVLVDPANRIFEISEVNNAAPSSAPLTIVSDALAIATRDLPAAHIASPYGVHLVATGGSGTYDFTIASGSLPSGLTLSRAGDIAGMPTEEGTWTFTAQVQSASQSATADYAIAVTRAGMPLTVITSQLPTAEFGKPYSVQLAAVGGAPAYGWSLSAGAEPPPGVVLAPDGTLEGAPGRDGAFAFQVEVEDTAGATAAQPLTLQVAPPDRMAIATASLPDAMLGKPYAATLVVAGARLPLTWAEPTSRLVPLDPTDPLPPPGSPLPRGLTLASDGSTARLEGVPTYAGLWELTFQVEDASGAKDTATFALLVRYDRGLAITTLGLPDGIVGKAYQAELAAEGADAAVHFAVVESEASRLPPGFSLSDEGLLAADEVQPPEADATGTRPARRTYSFLVRARDDRNRSALRGLSVTVKGEVLSTTTSTTCQAGPGGLAMLAALLPLLPLSRRRRGARPDGDAPRRPPGSFPMLAVAAILSASAPGCDDPVVAPVDRCASVTCEGPFACDPNDGQCKCGGEGGVVCDKDATCDVENKRCLRTACAAAQCLGGTTCDPFDGQCKCGGQGGPVCAPGQPCDPVSRRCSGLDRCAAAQCVGGTTCDPADGKCKCGSRVCDKFDTCTSGQCVASPCNGVRCTGGTTCDAQDGLCKCGGQGGQLCAFGEACQCPGGTVCADAQRTCFASSLCVGVRCAGGTTCDPADGRCKCGGPGGPACGFDQSCDVLARTCLGGDRCANVNCRPGLSCDPEDGTCKCGGLGGQACAELQVCQPFDDATSRCVTPCGLLERQCAPSEGCYFDIYLRMAFCQSAGAKAEGMGCSRATECGAGLHCQQQPYQPGVCRRYCDTGQASSCPSSPLPQRCLQLDGATSGAGACL